MAMIELKYSLNSAGKSLTVMPSADEKTCGLRDTSRIVAWRGTTHAPGMSMPANASADSKPG